jgi:hypothetical protein
MTLHPPVRKKRINEVEIEKTCNRRRWRKSVKITKKNKRRRTRWKDKKSVKGKGTSMLNFVSSVDFVSFVLWTFVTWFFKICKEICCAFLYAYASDIWARDTIASRILDPCLSTGPKTTRDEAHKLRLDKSISLEIKSFRGYYRNDILNCTNLRPNMRPLLHFYTCTIHCHFLSLLGCAPLGGLFHPIKILLENRKSDEEKARGEPRCRSLSNFIPLWMRLTFE